MKYVFLLMLLFSQSLFAQQADSTKMEKMAFLRLEDVVVTATRTKKDYDKLPIPVVQVLGTEIKNRGIVRLQEILAEQTGLAIINDHGMGIQMQGLNPDYTMILIDGEPIIGRTSGTLELSRISTNNIEKIEIIKGPSSSLYGSEAMAGVINIITSAPPYGLSSSFSTRYGTNNSTDVSVSGALKNKRWSLDAFANRNSSDGYSLIPQSGENTVSPFDNYTFSAKASYDLNKNTRINLSGRHFMNDQHERFAIDDRFVAGNGTVHETSVAPSISHHFSHRLFSSLRFYHSSYKTDSELDYEDNQNRYDQTFFKQVFTKAETQHDFRFSNQLILTAGIGGQAESVEATRYERLQSFQSGFGYLQADWSPTAKLNIIAGGRYDAHSEYKHQVSPKLAVSYQPHEKFTALASLGKGYKAPDFRQLYLNFSNAVVGYSVLGHSEAYDQLTAMQEAGQIQSVLVDPATLQQLDAESSTAFNVGFRYHPSLQLKWTLNFFRNDVKNLIETIPIAIKTNGQSVYTYSNLNEIFTRGIETELSYQLLPSLELAGGFQFMQAYDKDVLQAIEEGSVFARNPKTNETVVVKRQDYGGLINRSRYMANARVSFQHKGFISSFRTIYRGKYGLGDSNGNGIVDQANEFVGGYFLLNASVAKRLMNKRFTLQLTADNILNYTNPGFISNLPGRLLYIGVGYQLFSMKSSLSN